MRKIIGIGLLCVMLSVGASAQSTEIVADAAQPSISFIDGLKAAIERHLGRPYVWGASGEKSFDCSGFVWRVMFENGVLLKRTTARKFYMMLKPVAKSEQWKFGTLVFFDDLKHVGIVNSAETFYQAETSIGTNLSPMNSFWKKKIYGFRQFPGVGN